jgi:putative transposase
MACNEINIMDERLKFVLRILEGERMAVLCREFSISLQDKERYKEDAGLEALQNPICRPY